MRAEHIQRSRVGSCSAALPAWAAGKFTEAQAAAMGPVGLEMLNKRGVCALRLKVIADAAGVSIATTREALNIADTIGLIRARDGPGSMTSPGATRTPLKRSSRSSTRSTRSSRRGP